MLTTELVQFLSAALRSQAKTVKELARVTGLTEQETRSKLDTLRTGGFLSVDDDDLILRRPEPPIASAVEDTLSELGQQLHQAVLTVGSTLQALPVLIHAWDLGSLSDRSLATDLAHGPMAALDLWKRHFAQDTPASCDLVLPSLAPLLALSMPAEEAQAQWQNTATSSLRTRSLVSARDAHDADIRALMDRRAAAGTEIRVHPQPPSLFWVSDDHTVGLPLRWGEAWPTSMMTVRSEALAGLGRWLFDRLWKQATPYRSGGQEWDSMLHLLNEGLTIESAGNQLGISERTARRRVTAAMDHYGVTSHFALGAAWSRERASE